MDFARPQSAVLARRRVRLLARDAGKDGAVLVGDEIQKIPACWESVRCSP